jgi:TetR/AcrR family transcriptional regulator
VPTAATKRLRASHAQGRGRHGKTRIQEKNEQKILDAAEAVFAELGFEGATIDQISEKAQISKPNLHYYYKTKKILYVAVLNRVLESWMRPLATLDRRGDPVAELSRYIAIKLELTRRYPMASRVFANEILHGAPELQTYLRTDLKRMVDGKASAIRQWARSGKLVDIDPYHLIFLIWAATQHYADFLPQVKALMGITRLDRAEFKAIEASLCTIILHGILPYSERPSTPSGGRKRTRPRRRD